jgi:glyoxylase-like metal-dependent hydrolase (beta-lactamase superfamily II)
MKPSPKPDNTIEHAVELSLGKYKLEFLFTPGHSPGEYCIYIPEAKICFSGDVLFKQSIGRTDLWGGDYDTLIKSIETQLYVLPGDVKVYPGHESTTTIEFEKKNNPFVSTE